jgi:hypothetical protein
MPATAKRQKRLLASFSHRMHVHPFGSHKLVRLATGKVYFLFLNPSTDTIATRPMPKTQRREEFFSSAAKLLKTSGLFAIIDWFKKENLTRAEARKFIDLIEKGMLVELQIMDTTSVS